MVPPPKIPIFRNIWWFLLNLVPSHLLHLPKIEIFRKIRRFLLTLLLHNHQKYKFLKIWENLVVSLQSAHVSPPEIPNLGKIRWFLLNLVPPHHQKIQFLGKSRGFSSIWSCLIFSNHQKYQFLKIWVVPSHPGHGPTTRNSKFGENPVVSPQSAHVHQKFPFSSELGGSSSIWSHLPTKNVHFEENRAVPPPSHPAPPPLPLPQPLPPAPSISITPEKPQYLIGDAVSLRCLAPPTQKVQGFQFTATSGWAAHAVVAGRRRSYVYAFNVTGPRDGGAHACAYTVLDRARRPVRSILINVKDRPPRPTLTLTSSTGMAVQGHALAFLCAAPAADGERRFHFAREGGGAVGGATVATSANGEARLDVAKSEANHTGNFTCGYEEKTEGRWIASYPSPPVAVVVIENSWISPQSGPVPLPKIPIFSKTRRLPLPPAPPPLTAAPPPPQRLPPAPRLSVDPPGGLLSESYPLGLTCSASRASFPARFRFFRDGAELPPAGGGASPTDTASSGSSAHLLVPRSPRRFGGKFSCGVEEEVGGAWVATPRSDAVEVIVKDLPPPPALLLDPPSGRVAEGAPLLLTCAAAAPPAPRRFAFYKDGGQAYAADAAADHAHFRLAAATPALAAGRFSCRYEEKVGERWVPSPASQPVTVLVQARSQLIPLAAGCAAGAAALLLGLLLVVCLCRRRRGSAHWKGLHNKDDPGAYPMASVSASDL
ncbi:LOW QUALITY PROTEIN: uncharacterized protein LOC142364833 [Opisthocomus hoazin]|uniref:LOW QUALITY PROTEIN: uncharacterized protein LOC142364833 n=1 Tax=Opisthocomus hoazin TaxID=30419 RepID=UPI003F53914C